MSDLEPVVEALLDWIDPVNLRQPTETPFSVMLPDGHAMHLRYMASLDALSMTATLGRLLRSTRTQAGIELMMANLTFATQGGPHFALNTALEQLVLCRTALDATRDVSALAGEAKVFLETWQQSRDALAGAGLLD